MNINDIDATSAVVHYNYFNHVAYGTIYSITPIINITFPNGCYCYATEAVAKKYYHFVHVIKPGTFFLISILHVGKPRYTNM